MTTLSSIRGRAFVFGDNIDTDIIAPGNTISFGLGDALEDSDVKRNAFRAVRPDLYKTVREGDVLVAGRNFGLGSHREPANKALVSMGFRAVIAESVARLFFRNAVAIGFHVFQVPGILQFVREADELDIDIEGAQLRNVTQGTQLALEPYSPLIRRIIDHGGILEVMKSRLAAERA
ncbi:MAG: 3-isopropylmalate dehydratase small subunit [Casimicrobiaceae bacterium]